MNILFKIIAFIQLKIKVIFDEIPDLLQKFILPYSIDKALLQLKGNENDFVFAKIRVSPNHSINLVVAIKNYVQPYKNYYQNLWTLNLSLTYLSFNSQLKIKDFEDKRIKISEKDFEEINKTYNDKLNSNHDFNIYHLKDNLEELYCSWVEENQSYVLDYWFNKNPIFLLEKAPLILSSKNSRNLNYYLFLFEHIVNFINWKELLDWYNKLNNIYVWENQEYIEKMKKILISKTNWFAKK